MVGLRGRAGGAVRGLQRLSVAALARRGRVVEQDGLRHDRHGRGRFHVRLLGQPLSAQRLAVPRLERHGAHGRGRLQAVGGGERAAGGRRDCAGAGEQAHGREACARLAGRHGHGVSSAGAKPCQRGLCAVCGFRDGHNQLRREPHGRNGDHCARSRRGDEQHRDRLFGDRGHSRRNTWDAVCGAV